MNNPPTTERTPAAVGEMELANVADRAARVVVERFSDGMHVMLALRDALGNAATEDLADALIWFSDTLALEVAAARRRHW